MNDVYLGCVVAAVTMIIHSWCFFKDDPDRRSLTNVSLLLPGLGNAPDNKHCNNIATGRFLTNFFRFFDHIHNVYLNIYIMGLGRRNVSFHLCRFTIQSSLGKTMAN